MIDLSFPNAPLIPQTDAVFDDRKTEYERLEHFFAKQNRRNSLIVGAEEFDIIDKGSYRRRPARWAVMFTFRASDGKLLRVNRRFKGWWILRHSGVELPPKEKRNG